MAAMTAYEFCLDRIKQGRVAVCIAGQDEHGPAVMVPELADLSAVGYLAAYHPRQATRVGFIVGATVGLGRFVQSESNGFTVAGERAAQDA